MRGCAKPLAALGLLMIAACAGQAEPRLQVETTASDYSDDRRRVVSMLADLDDQSLTPDEQLANYTVDAVILPPDQAEIRGHDAIRRHVAGVQQVVDITMSHQIVELSSFRDVVVVQGKAVGEARPHDDPNVYPFETKNIIIFKRDADKGLLIWKVIFNAAPSAAA